MKRFEYCVIDNVYESSINYPASIIFSNSQEIDIRSKRLANVLDDLGKEGWEMVGCGTRSDGSRHTIYFKREI